MNKIYAKLRHSLSVQKYIWNWNWLE